MSTSTSTIRKETGQVSLNILLFLLKALSGAIPLHRGIQAVSTTGVGPWQEILPPTLATPRRELNYLDPVVVECRPWSSTHWRMYVWWWWLHREVPYIALRCAPCCIWPLGGRGECLSCLLLLHRHAFPASKLTFSNHTGFGKLNTFPGRNTFFVIHKSDWMNECDFFLCGCQF